MCHGGIFMSRCTSPSNLRGCVFRIGVPSHRIRTFDRKEMCMRYPRKDLFLCSVVVAIVALIGAGLAIERIITVGVQRDGRIMTPTGAR
jgi:hypothetical protein